MANKGSPFERAVATTLSLWWSGGRRTDLFWRSQTSGARSTVRARRGLRTAGQGGDIASTDPSSAAFSDVFAVECKRGYNRFTPFDAIDRPTRAATQHIESWVAQARAASEAQGSLTYLIVYRRDHRDTVVCFQSMLRDLLPDGERRALRKIQPQMTLSFAADMCGSRLSFIRFNDFLSCVTPDSVRRISQL